MWPNGQRLSTLLNTIRIYEGECARNKDIKYLRWSVLDTEIDILKSREPKLPVKEHLLVFLSIFYISSTISELFPDKSR